MSPAPPACYLEALRKNKHDMQPKTGHMCRRAHRRDVCVCVCMIHAGIWLMRMRRTAVIWLAYYFWTVNTCSYAREHTRIHTQKKRTHPHTRAHTHTHTHTHMHTSVFSRVWFISPPNLRMWEIGFSLISMLFCCPSLPGGPQPPNIWWMVYVSEL